MTETNKRIVEIDGVRIEVDLTTAKTIDTYRVGDNIKALVKDYSGWKVHPGVILAFDDFKTRPTITVGYFEGGGKMTRKHINGDSEDIELAPLRELDIPFQRQDVLKRMDREIAAQEQKLEQLNWERTYFNDCFAKYFGEFKDEAEVA